jgi:cytochrome c553
VELPKFWYESESDIRGIDDAEVFVGLPGMCRYNRRSIPCSEISGMRKPILILIFSLVILPGTVMAEGDAGAGKIKAYTCTGCHGIPGYKNTYPTYKVPKIGGQNAAYLVAALEAYQTGQRSHSTMNLQSESLGEEDIADIVAWLSSVEKESVTERSDSGIGDKAQVCEACHGRDGLGADPSYPVLAGQHSSYLARALKDYREGIRQNAIMGGFAASLSDKDIDELAAWYASLNGLKDLTGQ